ncbi:type II secretion system protein GspD [Aquabacterium soli]|uniref:Type II secretion system protein GspD n=1 Tax=Aquabacterium soli TaxID=2493092 RepID=A0A3R8TWB5_9BURK|nr:type II secretion system secretin GspD [Aquabacterium soli]RRS06206.1 type II secretion system protein GspD [Aquabacterium soli]
MLTHPLVSRPRAVALATTLALVFGPGGVLPLVSLLSAGQALAAPVKKEGATVTVNFVNAEIDGVARAMAAIIDRQIMVDPRVKGTITLYSEQPLTPREAYLNFLSALRGQGFALVEVAGLLKVVPEAEAKLQTGTVDVGNAVKRSGDQVLTQIFRLQYETANSMVTVLRPLISPNNTINANPTTNTLVITDYADNLRRIGQIIAAMDVPNATEMEAIPLQYAIASDLAPMVQRFADGGGTAVPGAAAGTQSTTVMAEPRTNTLLVRAANPARLVMLKGLIQRLDRPGSNGLAGSGINVVYLKNADAVKLAQILRAAFPTGGGSSSSSGGSSGTSSMPTSTTPTASTTSNSSSSLSSGSSSSSGASTQATAPVGASAQPSTGGFIQADPASNSLIITAPDALYRQLRAVIDQLDGRRAQIYIEAMVVEVSENKLNEVGIQWVSALGSTAGLGTNLPVGGIPGLLAAAVSPETTLANAKGLNIGVVKKNSNGTYSLGALANFLETKADGNVLSKPNMITLDNEEAKIVVGQNVPFVTGSYSTSSGGSTVSPYTTVERKDVGLTLRVRPQVGEGGVVRMTVFQENSSVEAATVNAANGPTTNKSSIETTVVIDDGSTLVLAGLLKDEYSNSDSQVPLLGDIPYLGNLFKSRSRERKKSNLMVFLRPVVMRGEEATNAVTLDRYDYMRQRQLAGQPIPWALPINSAPMLDPLKLSNDLSPPSVRQPLDMPGAPEPTVVMPPNSGYAPRLAPSTAVPVSPQPVVPTQPLPPVAPAFPSN